MIACGKHNTVVLDSKGKVWTVGTSPDSHYHEVHPEILPIQAEIVQVACGDYFTICLDSEGKLWILGHLLAYSRESILKPERIRSAPIVRDVTCGGDFAIFTDSNSRVWGIGQNTFGQLGTGDYNHRNKPTKIRSNPVHQVICGIYHTIIQDEATDDYMACGRNNAGQLAIPNITTEKLCHFTKIPNLESIVSVACGFDFSIFLHCDGTVYGVGSNYYGQLGVPKMEFPKVPKLQKIRGFQDIHKIFCGTFQTFCIDIVGDVYCCGYNAEGQLGLGDIQSHDSPCVSPYLKDIFFISQGRGGHHTIVEDKEGKTYSFGVNSKGQLGVGDFVNRNIPVQIFHSSMKRVKPIIHAKSARK